MAEEAKRRRRVNAWWLGLGIVIGAIVAATVLAITLPVYGPAGKPAYQADELAADRGVFSLEAKRAAPQEVSVTPRAEAPAAAPAAGAGWVATAAAATLAATQPMLIKTASLDLLVQDCEKAEAEVRRLAAKRGGFVASSETTKGEDGTYATITVRVPAGDLDKLVSEVSKLGRVTATGQSAEEVTEEYVDLQSRLRNDTREEEQLLRLMQRAGRVSDLLQVEKALADVRGRIEQATGRLRYLENRIALATLTVEITERSRATAPIAAWSALDVIKGAVAGLLATLRVLANTLIWALIVVGPFLLVAGVIWWAVRRRGARVPSGA